MLVGNIWVPVVTEWLLAAELTSALPWPASPTNTKEPKRNTSMGFFTNLSYISTAISSSVVEMSQRKPKNHHHHPKEKPSQTKNWDRDERQVLVADSTELLLPGVIHWQGGVTRQVDWISRSKEEKKLMLLKTTPNQTNLCLLITGYNTFAR